MKSMTAYASSEGTKDQLTVSVEIRSYNSKYLDISLRAPHGYLCLEDKIKSMISADIPRGRIEINLQIIDGCENAYVFDIDEPKALAYIKALSKLKTKFNINTDISLDLLVNAGGVVKSVETSKNMDKCWDSIKTCLDIALDDLNAMRKKEGDFIAKDFIDRLGFIEKSVGQIKKESENLLSHYQERLKKRINTLTQGMIDIDPARIAQEAAFLADRSDISEETVRVESHIKEFRAIMDSEESAGRKLNFLLQEFGREFNTMGSKAGNSNVSHIIVAVKSELEKIREQVQNIE
ncbi:MAG: YicC family protein [Proteobacteria bacterium]|nr:YicC family protein [Desulfobacteraceae bacterium]MBU3980798.1 YicC family protein [Pseudomonadota bacterium]MBU4011880.1 YicC family protein [Pseudomonadota bacterium]MBU4068091.1 YicC family protein [Pseudomonadota bacterium]MBU4100214.1 YicC family protein [Pseudomonadota bacterium]